MNIKIAQEDIIRIEPTIIFHYTSIDTLCKILESEKLRFTNVCHLNDKSEFSYGLNLFKTKIRAYETSNNLKKGIDDEFFNVLSASNHYSISFTENGDDYSFWNSRYVPTKNAVSIGFATNEIFKIHIINQCMYGDQYPDMNEENYHFLKKNLTQKTLEIHRN